AWQQLDTPANPAVISCPHRTLPGESTATVTLTCRRSVGDKYLVQFVAQAQALAGYAGSDSISCIGGPQRCLCHGDVYCRAGADVTGKADTKIPIDDSQAGKYCLTVVDAVHRVEKSGSIPTTVPTNMVLYSPDSPSRSFQLIQNAAVLLDKK